MKINIEYQNTSYVIDSEVYHKINIPIKRTEQPKAFYLSDAQYNTVEAGGFVGSVKKGGSCNVEDIFFSPHGNGTHTECAGHISTEAISIQDVHIDFFNHALLISIAPEGELITLNQIKKELENQYIEYINTLIVRTLPNSISKKSLDYSGTSPVYFEPSIFSYLRHLGILHFMTDLPSVDSENDNKLTAHHLFFQNIDTTWDVTRTITELVYIEDNVIDGLYFLQLQIAPFEADAAPSVPILYPFTMD